MVSDWFGDGAGYYTRVALVVTGIAALVVGGVSGAGVVTARDRGNGSALHVSAGAAAQAALAAPLDVMKVEPSCAEARRQADASLQEAALMEKSLAAHTAVMDRLLVGTITLEDAIKQTTPSLISGAAASARFDTAYADYRAVALRCPLP